MTRKVWALAAIAVFCGGAWLSAQKSTGKLTSDDLIEIQQLYAKYNAPQMLRDERPAPPGASPSS